MVFSKQHNLTFSFFCISGVWIYTQFENSLSKYHNEKTYLWTSSIYILHNDNYFLFCQCSIIDIYHNEKSCLSLLKCKADINHNESIISINLYSTYCICHNETCCFFRCFDKWCCIFHRNGCFLGHLWNIFIITRNGKIYGFQ